MSEILTIDTEAGIKSTIKDDELQILPLYDDNHPMLTQKIPIYEGRFPNGTLTVLSKRLKMTMKLYNGLGLAANQCGVFERMFVMQHDGKVLTCINPKIVDGYIEAAEVRAGDSCPECATEVVIDRAIEIGHIFQLGGALS